MCTALKIILFFSLVIAASCIKPYYPNLKNYKSLLVVEGLITNENNPYKIKLNRTFVHADSLPEEVIDAQVYITDSDGARTDLQNCGDGYYNTDSTLFRGVVGQKYILHIITSDGKEYISDECTMMPVTGIDTLYYEKSEEVLGNPGKAYTGINIMLNSAYDPGTNRYFRWTFEEVWKFFVPYHQTFTYTYINDTLFYFQSVPAHTSNCWKKNRSSEIVVNSISGGSTDQIKNQKIQFIAPSITDRLFEEYCILVKQYSISEKEFNYWKSIKQVGEPAIDIFGSQPFTIYGNIHNVHDQNEMVLGYFEVSAVTSKRMFITTNELKILDLPCYKNNCPYFRYSPEDFPPPPLPTWDEIYHGMVDLHHFVFIGPEVKENVVIPGLVGESQLIKFLFTTKKCSMCEETGFSTKPDFWIDLK